MPTIRRHGSQPSDPPAPAPAPPGTGGPPEHALLPLQVPEDTTPTWELEMLVSGAVLVGLFQLPPLLDGAWRAVVPRLLTPLAAHTASMAYVYAKGMVYALTVAFVVQLVARAYWVALVGLDSVFPQGVRWEKASYGPTMRAAAQKRVRSLPRLISVIDNFCSVMFAVGFLAVSLGLFASLLAALFGSLVWAIDAVLPGAAQATVWAVLTWLVFLPVIASRLERRLGDRVPSDGLLRRLFRFNARFNLGIVGLSLFGPILLTLTTNVRRRVAMPLLFLLLFGSMGFAFSDLLALRTASAARVYPLIPASLALRANDYRHYADQRTGDQTFARVPFIQSDVIRDPYVRLFIPYDVREDTRELKACTGASAAAAAATERCLASIHAVSVDGRPRTDLEYRYYTDAPSGLQGLLVYIPVGTLPHGHNLITVRRAPQADEQGRLRSAPPDSILFWL